MSSLVNGTPFPVNFRADKGGGGDTVNVRELEIEPLYEFCHFYSQKKTPALVKLCIDRDSAFINKLEPKSFSELAAKCIAVNFPNAITLMEGDPVIAVLLAPSLKETLSTAVSANLDSELLASAKQILARISAPPLDGAPSSSSSKTPSPSDSAIGTTSSAATPSADSSPSSPSSAASSPTTV